MAGNIIPAIATTNAIVAGMIVLQAMNLLEGKRERLCNCFLTYGTRRGTLFATEPLTTANPQCATCSIDRVLVRTNTEITRLGDLVRGVLPEADMEGLTLIEGSRIIYDPEDMPANAKKTLASLDCGDSRMIKFDFFDDDLKPLLAAIIHDPSCGNQVQCSNFVRIPKEAMPKDEDEEPLEPLEPATKKLRIDSKATIEEPIAIDDDVLILS